MAIVLNYCSTFLPYLGGIEQNVYYFAKYSEMKHLVLTDQLINTETFEKIENIDVYRAPPINPTNVKSKSQLLSKLFRELPRERNKKRLLETIQYDILHLRGPHLANDFFYGIDCLIGTSFFKKFSAWQNSQKPIVTTFHSLLSSTKFISKEVESTFWLYNEKKSWLKFEKFVCERSNEIICVDRFMKNSLEKITNGRAIHFIPSGIDCSIFKPIKKENAINLLPENIRKYFSNKFTILFLGRLDPMKGLPFLEELAKNLSSTLTIIQAGTGKIDIKSQNIIQVGNLENHLIPYLINSCDVVFAPLIIEGISRVSLESLACGKPVIMLGTHTDRYPIVNGKNGFVVDNVSEAIEIIIELFKSDSFYKQISTNALKTTEKFNVELLAKKLDKIYQSTI